MNGMRIIGAVCASILATSLGTLAACGGTPDQPKEASTAQAVSAASVSISLLDENGTRVGEATGVLIAPRLVLTAGHVISGKYKWVVTSADGKQKVNGSRGMTYDWRKYDSLKAHPRRHDVGVIHLDESIKLSAYPKLVAETSVDGTKATRIRGTGGAFEALDATLGKYRTSPNAWLADGRGGEALDTGGAVYDARGILGVVSGRGMTTGKLYVARVDGLVKWLAPKVACAGGATGVRTYAPPAADKSKAICEDGGAGTSSSGGSSSGNPGGGDNGGPNGDNGGPNGPGGDNGGSCNGNNDGVCSGGACGNAGSDGSSTPGSSGSSGAPGSNSSGGTNPGGEENGGPNAGSSGTNGNAGSSGNTGANPGGEQNGGPNGGGAGSNGNTSSSGNTGTNPGGEQNGGPNGGGPNGGGAGGSSTNPGSPEGEACQGASDNPDVCPPEPDGCAGPTCGGGQPDDSIDYGNCSCGGSSGSDVYLR